MRIRYAIAIGWRHCSTRTRNMMLKVFAEPVKPKPIFAIDNSLVDKRLLKMRLRRKQREK